MSKKRGRFVEEADVFHIRVATDLLREALFQLNQAEAHNAADKVRSAIKSADGARRHAEGMIQRQRIP